MAGDTAGGATDGEKHYYTHHRRGDITDVTNAKAKYVRMPTQHKATAGTQRSKGVLPTRQTLGHIYKWTCVMLAAGKRRTA